MRNKKKKKRRQRRRRRRDSLRALAQKLMSGTTPKPLDEEEREKEREKKLYRPVRGWDTLFLCFTLSLSVFLLSSVSSSRATFLQQLSLSEGDRERTKRRLNRGEDNDIVTPLACQRESWIIEGTKFRWRSMTTSLHFHSSTFPNPPDRSRNELWPTS